MNALTVRLPAGGHVRRHSAAAAELPHATDDCLSRNDQGGGGGEKCFDSRSPMFLTRLTVKGVSAVVTDVAHPLWSLLLLGGPHHPTALRVPKRNLAKMAELDSRGKLEALRRTMRDRDIDA